jgi:hypothetical protein
VVIWAANSRALGAHSGARTKRRSATSESKVLAEKGRPKPTFSWVTAAAQIGWSSTRWAAEARTRRRPR